MQIYQHSANASARSMHNAHRMPDVLAGLEAPVTNVDEIKERDARVQGRLLEKPGVQSEIALRQIALREAAHIAEPCALPAPGSHSMSPREYVRAFARAIVQSKDYQDVTMLKAANGTLHPTIEKLLLEYAYGAPTEDAEDSDNERKALEGLSSEELQERANRLAQGFQIQARHEKHECGGVPGNCYICKSKPAKMELLKK